MPNGKPRLRQGASNAILQTRAHDREHTHADLSAYDVFVTLDKGSEELLQRHALPLNVVARRADRFQRRV